MNTTTTKNVCGDKWYLNLDKPEEALKFLGFIAIFVIRTLLHHIMKPLGQPYLTTDFAVCQSLLDLGLPLLISILTQFLYASDRADSR